MSIEVIWKIAFTRYLDAGNGQKKLFSKRFIGDNRFTRESYHINVIEFGVVLDTQAF